MFQAVDVLNAVHVRSHKAFSGAVLTITFSGVFF